MVIEYKDTLIKSFDIFYSFDCSKIDIIGSSLANPNLEKGYIWPQYLGR